MVSLLAPAPYITSLKMRKLRRRKQCLTILDQKIGGVQAAIEQATAELKRTKTERDTFVWQTCSMSRDEEYERTLHSFDQLSESLFDKLSGLRLELLHYSKRRSQLASR